MSDDGRASHPGPEGRGGGRPALRSLASRLGIELRYESALDGRSVEVSDATLVALVAACGRDASTEAAARDTLAALEAEQAARVLAPFRVVEQGAPDAAWLTLRIPGGRPGRRVGTRVRGVLVTESGERHELRAGAAAAGALGRPEGGHAIRRVLALPAELPLGHHRIEIELAGAGEPLCQQLVVAPGRAFGVEQRLGPGRRGWGIHANLYAVRGERGLGHGDLGDLRDLVALAGRHGASFVGINPIHAGTHASGEGSPYAPIDRAWHDPIYLDLERLAAPADRVGLRDRLAAGEVASLRGASALDRARVWRHKRALLAELFDASRRSGALEPGPVEDHLRDHATFLAIAEWLEERGEPGVDPWDWRTWPAAYRSPAGSAVARFRDEHRDAVALHVWLQRELDRQLGEVAEAARSAGVSLGLVIDLALGSRPGGVETWRDPSLFASAVEAGAPPDAYAPQGQSWGFPPIDPGRLVDGRGHLSWLALLRASLAHAGALRLDHVLSLNRLYWVPRGGSAGAGAYVRYPERELLGLLALESHRRGVALIGEDLGTVPAGFSDRIRDRGLLSTRVLYFERDGDRFRPAAEYPERALASANTHDLAPVAGWWSGTDLRLRRDVGQLRDADWDAARQERGRERAALAERLGLPAPEESDSPGSDESAPEQAEVATAAAVDFLAGTPCVLVGVSLDDLAGERVPINLPGVPESVYPSWTRRMKRSPSDIERSPLARRCFASLARAGRWTDGTGSD